MSDLRNDVEVFCMLEELLHESVRLSDKDAEHLEWISGKERLMPADFAWIRLRHGELHKGVNDMAKRNKKDDGGTATLEPIPGKKPGEQGQLLEVDTVLARKFKALDDELQEAKATKREGHDRAVAVLNKIRALAKKSDLQRNADGSLCFTAEDLKISISPGEEVVSVKHISREPKKAKRSKGESPD